MKIGLCCSPIGTPGTPTNEGCQCSMENIGTGEDLYNTGSIDPFEIRRIQSTGDVDVSTVSDPNPDDSVRVHHSVAIADRAGGDETLVAVPSKTSVNGDVELFLKDLSEGDFIELSSDDNTVTITASGLANVGGGAQVFVDGTSFPHNLRSFTSPDSSVNILQTATEIELTVPPPPSSGTDVFQVDGSNTASNGTASYVVLETLAGDAKVLTDEEWKINLCVFICHPGGLFNINTFVDWQIEGPANIWTTIDEWQVNWPITISPGQTSCPAHRTIKQTPIMDAPRMRCRFRLSVASAGTPTQVEIPRWGGVQIAEAP